MWINFYLFSKKSAKIKLDQPELIKDQQQGRSRHEQPGTEGGNHEELREAKVEGRRRGQADDGDERGHGRGQNRRIARRAQGGGPDIATGPPRKPFLKGFFY